MKIPRPVLNLAFYISLGALVLGLGLHLLTYFGIDPRTSLRWIWYPFQYLVALAIIPLFISGFRSTPQTPFKPAGTPDKFREILALIFGLFAFYCFFDFVFTGSFLLHDQSPEIINGHYAMGVHGQSHPVTEAEFLRYSAYEARLFSGHWMLVCSMIAGELYLYLLRELPQPR